MAIAWGKCGLIHIHILLRKKYYYYFLFKVYFLLLKLFHFFHHSPRLIKKRVLSNCGSKVMENLIGESISGENKAKCVVVWSVYVFVCVRVYTGHPF